MYIHIYIYMYLHTLAYIHEGICRCVCIGFSSKVKASGILGSWLFEFRPMPSLGQGTFYLQGSDQEELQVRSYPKAKKGGSLGSDLR